MPTPNLASGTFINGLPTGTIDNMQALLVLEKGQPSSPQTIQTQLLAVAQFLQTNFLNGNFQPTGSAYPMAGYISENAAQLTYITGTSYQVEAGSMDINGTNVQWASASVRTGVTLTSGTMNYVYGYSTGTTIGLEESTTAPVWDGTLNYYKKTGDNTRRCIGFLQAQTVNSIRPFINVVKSRISEFTFQDYTDGKLLVNNATITGAWTTMNLGTYLPTQTNEALILGKLVLASSGDEGTLGISTMLPSAATAPNTVIYQLRDRAPAAGANVFFGNAWLTVYDPVKLYAKLLITNGAPACQIGIWGCRFIR